MKRRSFLTTTLAGAATITLVSCAGQYLTTNQQDASKQSLASAGAAQPREVRITYSKFGPLATIRKQNRLEEAIAGTGYSIRWREFAAGPQQLEALNAGSLDITSTAESPAIFAQAAGAPMVYLATSVPRPKGIAFLVPADSPIQSIADFRGRKIALQKASLAYYILIKALKEEGLSLDDISPAYLPPPEANVAFSQAQVDAWVVWEPYIGRVEQSGAGRVLRFGDELVDVGGFYSASRTFAEGHPDFVKLFLAEVQKAEKWGNEHPREQAELLAEETQIEVDTLEKIVSRQTYGILPITEQVVVTQQRVADMYFDLGLLPEKLDIREVILPQGYYTKVFPKNAVS